SSDAATAMSVGFIKASTTLNQWEQIMRNLLLFPTFSLPSNAVIIEAVLSIYGYGKIDQLGILPSYNVYSSNPALNTALTWTDFSTLGDVPLCDTPIGFSAWSITGFNSFLLNAAGIAALTTQKMAKLGLRTTYDAEGITPPNWVSGAYTRLQAYCSEQGDGYKPKLVITYTTVTGLETLRPHAPGDTCNISLETGDDCPNHYLNVDEVEPDEGATQVYSATTPTYGTSYDLHRSSHGGGRAPECDTYRGEQLPQPLPVIIGHFVDQKKER
ncbi:unnamed protein product, partial [marine sediment metagenome]